jgi:hypothetical protein
MRLTELEPEFFRYEDREEMVDFVDGKRMHRVQYSVPVSSVAEAQCLWFLCPLCFQANHNSNKGTHMVEVSFADRGVQDHQGTHNKEGKPVRWNVSGSGFEDLSTLPSILLEGGCAWHGYITNGEVQ